MNEFKKLAQNTLRRFQFGGILKDDFVEITSTEVEGGNSDFTDKLKSFKESGRNIRVSSVTSTAADNSDSITPNMCLATIGLELANGIYEDKITVPAKILKVVSYGTPDGVPDQHKDQRELDRDGSPESVEKFEGSDVHLG